MIRRDPKPVICGPDSATSSKVLCRSVLWDDNPGNHQSWGRHLYVLTLPLAKSADPLGVTSMRVFSLSLISTPSLSLSLYFLPLRQILLYVTQ